MTTAKAAWSSKTIGVRIHWPGAGGQANFERVNQKLLDATRPLGGTYVPNPTWSKLTDRNLTTVHPLGGCVMAERAEEGVVNHKRSGLFRGRAMPSTTASWSGTDRSSPVLSASIPCSRFPP